MIIIAPGHAHKAHSRDLKNDANIESIPIVINYCADTETPIDRKSDQDSLRFSVPKG